MPGAKAQMRHLEPCIPPCRLTGPFVEEAPKAGPRAMPAVVDVRSSTASGRTQVGDLLTAQVEPPPLRERAAFTNNPRLEWRLREDRFVLHRVPVGADRDDEELERAEPVVPERIDPLREDRLERPVEDDREGRPRLVVPRVGLPASRG